jgi:ABC-type transport system involved in multi-copper enzyme maturation permease subunit
VVFFLGHLMSSLVSDAKMIGITGVKLFFVEALYYLFPNLEKFDIRNLAVHAVSQPLSAFGFAVLYAFIYVALLLIAASWIFEKKEI